MPVDTEPATPLDLGDHDRELGLTPTQPRLDLDEPPGQLTIIEPRNLRHHLGEHAPIMRTRV